MLEFQHRGTKLCDGMTRRAWLSAGSLGALGLSLPEYCTRRASAADSPAVPPARAKACIQIYLWGGPGAQETWDLKPAAPEPTRGEFQPIATSLPGTHFCEHLPLLSQRAHCYTIIRSATHEGTNHGTSAYHMLTGHLHWSPGTLRHPTKNDMPNIGCNASRFLAHPGHLPPHVQLPAVINDGDQLPVPGQWAGILGDRHDPFKVIGNLTRPDFQVPALSLAEGVSRARLNQSAELRRTLAAVQERVSSSNVAAADAAFHQALNLLQSAQTEEAFNLSREPETIRLRYGMHYFGQSLLLARRLVEAGVPFVTVYWNPPDVNANFDNESWDTHKNQHERMRKFLLPPFDQGLAALFDDLVDRGMLDETLVTWWGEFGRTPKINSLGGRDHWGFCQSIGLAGGGIQQGLVYGSSTNDGGYAETCPVRPDDLSATMFHLLGIDHKQMMHDLAGRPIPLSHGEPVEAVLA